jgi:hypothetical protein
MKKGAAFTSEDRAFKLLVFLLIGLPTSLTGIPILLLVAVEESPSIEASSHRRFLIATKCYTQVDSDKGFVTVGLAWPRCDSARLVAFKEEIFSVDIFWCGICTK